MIWDDFKQMPAYVQAEYITNLQKKFGVTAVDLGDMFGVRALTVRKHADANNLGIEFPRGHAMNAARRAEWAKFLGEEEHDEVNVPAPASLSESSLAPPEFLVPLNPCAIKTRGHGSSLSGITISP